MDQRAARMWKGLLLITSPHRSSIKHFSVFELFFLFYGPVLVLGQSRCSYRVFLATAKSIGEKAFKRSHTVENKIIIYSFYYKARWGFIWILWNKNQNEIGTAIQSIQAEGEQMCCNNGKDEKNNVYFEH